MIPKIVSSNPNSTNHVLDLEKYRVKGEDNVLSKVFIGRDRGAFVRKNPN